MALLQDPSIKKYTMGHAIMYESIFLLLLFLTFGAGWLWLLWGFKAVVVLLVIACFFPYPRKNIMRISSYSLYLIPAINIFLLCFFGWHLMPGFIVTYFISLAFLTGKQMVVIEEMDEEWTQRVTMKNLYKEKTKGYWETQDPV
jgi:hypothetical protein